MQNSKLQKIPKGKVYKKFVDWRVKIRVLKDQISEIEKFKKIPIFAIVLFLLKTEIIEFELK